jgi:DNA-binding transcriptional MerR regulator
MGVIVGVMEPSARPDSAALIDLAASQGHKVTPRALELWRYRGLLPRPERQAGRRAVWLYPAGTEQHLLRFLHWRQRTRNLDEVLVALWVEGFEISPDRVREALSRFVERWEEMIEAEVSGSSKKGEAAFVDALARKFARMRGEASLPRLSRMRLEDRERACGYLVAAMFGMDDELAKREEDVPHLERLLGLRRGHDGGISPLLGLKDGMNQMARLPTPAETREPIRTAQPEELELVRRIIQLFLFVFPQALPALFADQAAKAVDIIDFARSSFTEPPPPFLPFLATVFLVSLRAKDPVSADLRAHIDALDPDIVRHQLTQLTSSE